MNVLVSDCLNVSLMRWNLWIILSHNPKPSTQNPAPFFKGYM